MESRLGGWAPMVCLSYLGVLGECAWVGGEAENESVLKMVQLRWLYNIQIVKFSSGWKDESAMWGTDLYWRYRGGSHWLTRKMKLWGWTWREYVVEREPKSEFWEASEFMRTLPKSLLMTSLRRGGGVGAVGEVRNILTLLLGPMVCGAEGCKGRAGLWKPGDEGKKVIPEMRTAGGRGGRGGRKESIQKFCGGKRMLDWELSDQGHHRRWMREGKEPFQSGFSCGAYRQWILLSCQKEWNNAICSNMDGARDDHIQWSKSERDRQLSYDITLMWNPKKYESRSVVSDSLWLHGL